MKFCRCLFTLSIKHEIMHFHVIVVQKQQRSAEESMLQMQCFCFAY